MKFLKFEREARLLGPGKELIFPLTRLCTPITPQATQVHNKKDCWNLFIYEISIIIIFFEIEKAEWWKIITRTLWKNNKEKRGPASSSRWNR